MEIEEKNISNFIHDIIDEDLSVDPALKIHTRFPPEPNGYLHIGSVKAICVNTDVANKYSGLFNLRYDDTNPAKESDEFVRSIREDLEWLGATPTGGVFGGSGMYLPIEEMIKLGILYLQDGVWNGERLLSHEWIEMVSTKQIDTRNPDPWHSGYSFQFWMIGQQPGAFRCDGLYGQYSLILPKENAVIAIQSNEENDVLKIIPLILKYLIS